MKKLDKKMINQKFNIRLVKEQTIKKEYENVDHQDIAHSKKRIEDFYYYKLTKIVFLPIN